MDENSMTDKKLYDVDVAEITIIGEGTVDYSSENCFTKQVEYSFIMNV